MKNILKKTLNLFNIFFQRFKNEQIKKINVGSGYVAFDEDWFSCDIDILNLTKRTDWILLLKNRRVRNIFAEHVWEHLSEGDTLLANNNCYEFLKKGGRLRIAVPDGFHPNQEYINYVKPNGTGIGSDDHKILYNYKVMTEKLEKAGFKIALLEYWDENGKFHYIDWSNNHGKVTRSKRYDSRNIDGKLNYTSLIVDAFK